uniref:Secreted protein n=1 Tax=Anguilla anguilla TaxID=7936 RepID=A0A0E9WDS8_ANGAN
MLDCLHFFFYHVVGTFLGVQGVESMATEPVWDQVSARAFVAIYGNCECEEAQVQRNETTSLQGSLKNLSTSELLFLDGHS